MIDIGNACPGIFFGHIGKRDGPQAWQVAVLPIATDGLGRAGLWELLSWASRMFAAGLLMTMPVVISLLLVNIGLGIVSRAAPQLNIFAVGFPISLMMGFLLIWATLPQVMKNFTGLVDEAFNVSAAMLGAG